MPFHPSKTTTTTIKARPLVTIVPLSHLVIVKPIQLVLITLLPVAPTMDPVIKIAPTHQVKPANHVSAINAVSPKKHAKLKGLSAKCTTLPLVPKLPKTLRHCKTTNTSKRCVPPALSGSNQTYHQVAIVTLTPLTMLTIVDAPYTSAAALLAICAVALAAMISMPSSNACHSSHYHDFPPPTKHRVIDIRNHEPIATASITSAVLPHSDGPDHTSSHNNLDEYHYQPVHFDGHSNCKNPIAAKCQATDPKSYSSKESYIGQKPPADTPPEFDVYNHTNPETKQYSYWYN